MPTALMEHARFTDRRDAGKRLAEQLLKRHDTNPVILALPRGGVPVAVEIARALRAPLDLILVRKIGVPGHEELALGAVVDGEAPQLLINEGIRQAVNIDDARLAEIESRELREIERRRTQYLHDRHPVSLDNATAIVVDDGIATGATMRVALDAVRLRHPAHLVVATSVASPELAEQLRSETDDVVCLYEPDPLHAVGLYYEDFGQVSDEEVVDLLESVSDQS